MTVETDRQEARLFVHVICCAFNMLHVTYVTINVQCTYGPGFECRVQRNKWNKWHYAERSPSTAITARSCGCNAVNILIRFGCAAHGDSITVQPINSVWFLFTFFVCLLCDSLVSCAQESNAFDLFWWNRNLPAPHKFEPFAWDRDRHNTETTEATFVLEPDVVTVFVCVHI